MTSPIITDEQFASLLSQSDDELLLRSKNVAARFLPDDALFSASLKERLDLYITESFSQDLKRWGQKGSELLDQLSKPEAVADIRLIASIGAFVMARVLGIHDVPVADLAAFALLLVRSYRRKDSKRDAGV